MVEGGRGREGSVTWSAGARSGARRGAAHLLLIVADALEHVIQRLQVGPSWAAVGDADPVRAAALADLVSVGVRVRVRVGVRVRVRVRVRVKG